MNEDESQDPPRVAIIPAGDQESPVEKAIEEPGKLLRIATMLRELIVEAQRSPLDEGGRTRLADIYRRSLSELGEALSDDLREELAELAPPLEQEASDSEVRVAQAQLVGWLEGLFHGIQAALWTQQMQARAAFEEMRRRSLPSGTGPGGQGEQGEQRESPQGEGPPGQYL